MKVARIGLRALTIVASASLVFSTAAATVAAAPVPGPSWASLPAADGVVLVGFRPGTSASDRAAARASVNAMSARQLSPLAPDDERLVLPAAASTGGAILALLRNPNVRYAEPDYLLTTALASDDPYYTSGSLWGMHGDGIASSANPYGTGADEAWADGLVGSSSVYVGVIDEGIQYTHPDLAANIWTNPYDPVDGIDNDGNGYVDDVHGFDFYYDDNSIFDGGAGSSIDAHGTHVSGTIGGQGGNGLGVAGVNWNVTIISAKFLGPNGGYTSDAVLAVDYLTDLKTRHGLDIVASSNSWGGGGSSSALLAAIRRSGDAEMLFVAAAGNASTNIDSAPSYPAAYDCSFRADGTPRGYDCVISVASITSSGALSSFSNYGATAVDLGAPGSGVMSSVPIDAYASYSGTSMATPHVSGAVALCAAANPSLTAGEIRSAIMTTAAPTSSLVGRTVTGGRLDVGAMARACGSAGPGLPTIPTASLPDATISVPYTAKVDAAGGMPPYVFSMADGALPPGLELDPATGTIAGTPTGSTETAGFTIGVTDASAATTTKPLAIRVATPLAILTTTLPDGQGGTPYSATLAAVGGATPYAWSLVAGSLPAGLTLSGAGVLSGTPTTAGTSSFTVGVRDAGNPTRAASEALTLTVTLGPPGAFAKSSPKNGAKNQSASVTLSWVASARAATYEVCVDRTNDNVCDPTGFRYWVTSGANRSISLTGLSRSTTYYWQVRAVNTTGTTLANAGTWWSFRTR